MDIQHAAIKELLKSLGESTLPDMCAWVLDLPESGMWQAIFALEHKPESRFREAAALLKALLTSDTWPSGACACITQHSNFARNPHDGGWQAKAVTGW